DYFCFESIFAPCQRDFQRVQLRLTTRQEVWKCCVELTDFGVGAPSSEGASRLHQVTLLG
ncbi:hypothetical protein, partial [Pseudomonas sp. SIMBA_021]|uniref:hypothetical protein n=1 Tax=Pseudomonas sp. SIMBA_021 TaxID=3085767 RepID=UPI00397D5A7D